MWLFGSQFVRNTVATGYRFCVIKLASVAGWFLPTAEEILPGVVQDHQRCAHTLVWTDVFHLNLQAWSHTRALTNILSTCLFSVPNAALL